MKLEALISSVNPLQVTGNMDREICGITCDSRQVRPGFLFVAVPGASQDGWSFAEDAVLRGAAAVVSERERGPQSRGEDVVYLQVPDAREALAWLACAYAGHPSRELEMIGVTGTNGKTTVAYMIRDILRAAGREPGIISTVQYEIGERVIPAVRTTPAAVELQALLSQMVSAGCGSAVMEVSSHALSQKRVAGIDYHVAVFTNLTRDHLDYHGSVEEYFGAKALLFLALGEERGVEGDLTTPRSVAVLNVDDPYGERLKDCIGSRADIVTYGLSDRANVTAKDLELTSRGTGFEVITPWGNSLLHSRLLGRFNVSNVLGAVAACGALGVDLSVMSKALSGMRLVPGRLEELKTNCGFQAFVDYAHTDDALEHVLTTLREITRNRLIVVFGCGGDRDRTKRPAMGAVAARCADLAIITSDNPRREAPEDIIAEIRSGFNSHGTYEIIEDRREAIRSALREAGEGDVVLVAGKGHENFQEFANKTITFDDRQVVREALGEM